MKKILENWNRYLEEQDSALNLFVLVGPPSVGKTSWINDAFVDKEPYIINRDDIAEHVASSYGWTYDDMFVAPPPDAEEGNADEKYGTVIKSPSFMTWQPLSFDKVVGANNEIQKLFAEKVSGAVPSGKDIVVDMTNMNAAARKRALEPIKDTEGGYRKIAVVFEFEGAEDFIKRVAASRSEAAKRMGKSKTIPDDAFNRMFGAFERIDPAEGFDEVVSVDNRELLQKLANTGGGAENDRNEAPAEEL